MNRKPIRIFCIRKAWWQIALTACLALAMFLVVAKPPFVETAASPRQLPIYCVDRGGQKLISISFDAAWGNVIMRPSSFKGLRAQILNMDAKRTVPVSERSFLFCKLSGISEQFVLV